MDYSEFEQNLAEVERSLVALKERYTQVRANQQRQQVLSEQRAQLESQVRRNPTKPLKVELAQIKTQLEELEIALESHLFSFQGLREVFWQIVRFGGLGILIGWGLRSLAG